MAIKAGQLVHAGNETVIIDRIQTGGPGQVNIPTEKIYELGNYQSVGTIRDTPDLSFTLDSFDTSTEVETMLTNAYVGRTVTDGVTAASTTVTSATAVFTSADVGRMIIIQGEGVAGKQYVGTITVIGSATSITVSPATVGSGSGKTIRIAPNGVDLVNSVPVDIASQFKAGQTTTTPYNVISSVCLPFLYAESMAYRFGQRDNASQNASLRGDAIFYAPGPAYVQTAVGTNTPGQAVITANAAYASAGADGRRVFSVTVDSTRLTLGVDYTESYGSITLGAAVTTVTIVAAVPTTSTIRIMYASPVVKQYLQAVHPLSTVIPAAVRGKDIDVFLSASSTGYDPNAVTASQTNKLTRVQSVNVDWRAQIDKDEELGNAYAYGQDFNVPDVTGSVDFKPASPTELQAILRKITGVSDVYAAVEATQAAPLYLDIVIKNPTTGVALKRLRVPDARFTIPGIQGRVQTKSTITANFESDGGTLTVYEA